MIKITLHSKPTPNYDLPCSICGAKPTVSLETLDNGIKEDTELCGPCCFGVADCIDPQKW